MTGTLDKSENNNMKIKGGGGGEELDQRNMNKNY
jgi:hypothetical protein